MALKSDGDAVLVARQRHQHFAVAFGQIRKIQRSGRTMDSNGDRAACRQAISPCALSRSSSLSLVRGSDPCSVEVFSGSELGKFKTKADEALRQTSRPPAFWTRTAQ